MKITRRSLYIPLVCSMVVVGVPALTRVARACDACLEDKIAATYDWQIVSAAKQQGHTVVFGAIKGPLAPGDAAVKSRLDRVLSAVPGVDSRSVRVSLAPPAISFSSDLRRHSAAALLATMNERLRGSGLQLVLLRIGAPGMAGTVARTSP